jgi:hypothetical protein
MLLTDLLDSTVIDADGTEVGGVDDVRLVQSGPLLEGFGAALVVDGLVIGTGSIAVRLGFHRKNVRGPAVLKQLGRALESRAWFVPWQDVESWQNGLVRLRISMAQVSRLTDAL